MNTDDRKIVNDALSMYGASLSDNDYIKRGEKITQVIVESRKNRFEFVSTNHAIKLAHSPKTIDGVCKFVEAFWMWEKINGK